MSSPRRLLVIAPNWLGDAVMALPSLSDVRRTFAGARLIVAARRTVADLFAMTPELDEIVMLESKGRWWQRAATDRDAARLAAAGADAALILPNSFASAWLVKKAGVQERWGYASDWRSMLLTRSVPLPRGSQHQGAYYQTLTRSLGIDSGPLAPALTVPDTAIAAARAQLTAEGWNGHSAIVVFAPGAAYGTAKRWMPAHVAALISALIEKDGATCVMVGSGGDVVTTRQIAALVANGPPKGGPYEGGPYEGGPYEGGPYEGGSYDSVRGGRLQPARLERRLIDLAGRTTVIEMAAVLRLARACVSNDSGAMHIAGAIGTPVVAIFGPTREKETAPLTRPGGHAEVLTHPVWCRPCMLRECPIDHRCMTGIKPARVQQAVERLLA